MTRGIRGMVRHGIMTHIGIGLAIGVRHGIQVTIPDIITILRILPVPEHIARHHREHIVRCVQAKAVVDMQQHVREQ